MPAWGLAGIVFFFIGVVALGINFVKRPKPISKAFLYAAPQPDLSIYGVIGSISWGFAFFAVAYSVYLEPQIATQKGKWYVTLGGPYGLALICGFAGLLMFNVGARRIYNYLKQK